MVQGSGELTIVTDFQRAGKISCTVSVAAKLGSL